MKHIIKKNILFIANANFASKKISTYQTLCQAHSLSKHSNITLILPNRFDLKKSKQNIKNLAKKRLNIKSKINFKIKCINYFDISHFQWLNHHVRFTLSNIGFSLSAIKNIWEGNYQIIYTRDFYTMVFLSILKNLKIISKPILFESHQFSFIRKIFLKNIDYLILINSFQKKIYDHKNSIVLHDCIWKSDIKKIKNTSYIKNTIFYSGTCNKIKGIERILHLANYLKDYKFYIASLENYKNNNIPKELYKENIIWLGNLNRDQLNIYMEKMEYFILPNDPFYKENFYTSPMKLFEYLAYKKGIIASQINTIKEILNESDYLTLPSNPADFDKVSDIIRESNTNKISKNYTKIISNYTWEKRAEKLLEFINFL